MGKAGIFVNIGAILWLLTVWVFCFFPLTIAHPALSLHTMNWNCLIYGGSMIVGIAYWFIQGRKIYTPPVMFVARDRT